MSTNSSFRRAMPGVESLRRRRAVVLSVLLVLDGFALGGCVTSLMMRDLVGRMMAVYQDQAQVIAVYNLIDHILPYYLYFGGALLALTVTTACVWFATRPPKAL
ncbi:MAG: hypothetical protein WBB22_07670 [Anaerolineae bacterium]